MTAVFTWSPRSGSPGALVTVQATVGQATEIPPSDLGIGPEARDRTRAALYNSGESNPPTALHISFSPPLRPPSTISDLAIAVAIAAAHDPAMSARLAGTLLVGELGLDGSLRPIPGIAQAVDTARAAGFDRVVVPRLAVSEPIVGGDTQILVADHLRAVLAWLRGTAVLLNISVSPTALGHSQTVPGLVLELAAAGRHALAVTVPSRSESWLLAQHLHRLLPGLTGGEADELADVRAQLDEHEHRTPLRDRVPSFVEVNHSISVPALIGSRRPGAVSRAHCGLLFIDDYPLLPTQSLHALRQVAGQGYARGIQLRHPARCQLLLTAGHCACTGTTTGNGLSSSAPWVECVCPPGFAAAYRARRHGGPLAEHIDLRLNVADLGLSVLAAEFTAARLRVAYAREAARSRWRASAGECNAEVSAETLYERLRDRRRVTDALDRLVHLGAVTERGAARILGVAWTLCDLRGDPAPTVADLDTALQLRRDCGQVSDTR
ncbi:ATP-binding protein [Nocardia brasiliensis]